MSATISASAGEPMLCKGTKRASLWSRRVFSGVSRSTSSELSSGQLVTPSSYSDSQTGQNIRKPPGIKLIGETEERGDYTRKPGTVNRDQKEARSSGHGLRFAVYDIT